MIGAITTGFTLAMTVLMTPPSQAEAPAPAGRWASDSYPDYVAEVNQSIAFSGASQDFFTRGKAVRFLELLRRKGEDPATMRLLDIGCGVGLVHRHLQPNFGAIVGVDVADEALAQARADNRHVRYETYDGFRLPFADRSFDAALTICVMHHVPPPQWPAFVAEAHRVLRPGGVFAVFEHNPWNLLTRLAVARCAFDFDAVLLRPPRLTRLLIEGGFEDVSREFLFFTPFSAELVQSAERRLRWCPIGAQFVAFGRRPAIKAMSGAPGPLGKEENVPKFGGSRTDFLKF